MEKDALKDFWTTDKSVLMDRTTTRDAAPPAGRLRQRIDQYIFRRAIQAQGFEVETHHCARTPWYEKTLADVRASGLPTREFSVGVDRFDAYLSRHLKTYDAQGYVAQYGGVHGYFSEKAIEHLLSVELLRPKSGDKVLDIASWGSPAAEILATETGAAFYKHDITFTTNMDERVVSGPAEALDAPDGFFDMLMAHCAIDNFEGESDSWLFKDAARVLRPGGQFLIIPLHLADRAENLVALGSSAVPIDEETTLVLKPARAARFCRHYSIASLRKRLLDTTRVWRHEIVIFKDLPTEKYPNTQNCRFALLATRVS